MGFAVKPCAVGPGNDVNAGRIIALLMPYLISGRFGIKAMMFSAGVLTVAGDSTVAEMFLRPSICERLKTL